MRGRIPANIFIILAIILSNISPFLAEEIIADFELTNSGGKVTLINNFDKHIGVVEYLKAISGEFWSYIGSKW